ncbi:uncharacterized protein EMH_0059110 [Eimeria mitis]|uniref:Uncharacterized protein n=1 Tax=Eimeria mitis TaxID=44415 RepID=U6K2I5_9EIME|nr:uncharacterized protein EMH_0059110 [Eimeria mitis]CDJ30537.1 hypothetical protein EMH_0059110 [Eimeria mitis]
MLSLLLLVLISTAVLAAPVEKPVEGIPGEPHLDSQNARRNVDEVNELSASYRLHVPAKQARPYLSNISAAFIALAIVYFAHIITKYQKVKAEGDDVDERSLQGERLHPNIRDACLVSLGIDSSVAGDSKDELALRRLPDE